MATSEWRGTSDHNVTETAFDAVKCKVNSDVELWLAMYHSEISETRSAVTQGYFQDPFLSFFVDKPTRRIPLIHRGYYLRHLAITRCVELFLSQSQRACAGSLHFVEVDCQAIVDGKTRLLNDGEVRAGLLPNDISNLTVEAASEHVAWQGRLPSALYSLIACDLGDMKQLDAALDAAGVDRSLPTLILAECVLSYLAPDKGTALLGWLAKTFLCGSIALYDPIGLRASNKGDDDNTVSPVNQQVNDSSAFGTTLQQYFAVKGCTLRGARGFQTAADHARRLLALARWKRCCILDMNSVFEICASADEKRRLTSLEPFDEYADWVLCNSHYAIYLADNAKDSAAQWTTDFAPPTHQHRLLVTASMIPDRKSPVSSSVVIIRSFQNDDLAVVRSLFESTHLEFAHGSRAVRQFVANRLRGPGGDMFDVEQSFQTRSKTGVMTSGFWVAEMDGDIVGCVGVKPLVTTTRSSSSKDEHGIAELCRLSVDPAYRRRGLASALVNTVEAFVATCDMFREIRLETIGAMGGAQQLYRTLGYVEQEPDTDTQHSNSFTLVRFHKGDLA